LGLCTWGVTNMVVGWVLGFWGLLGAQKAELKDGSFWRIGATEGKTDSGFPWVNLLGVLLAMGASVVYMFIVPDTKGADLDETLIGPDDWDGSKSESARKVKQEMELAARKECGADGEPQSEDSSEGSSSEEEVSPVTKKGIASGVDTSNPISATGEKVRGKVVQLGRKFTWNPDSATFSDCQGKSLLDEGLNNTTPVSNTEVTRTRIGTEVYEEKPQTTARLIQGFALAMAAGTFYAFNFNPVFFIVNERKAQGASQEILDYVFWHFLGILCLSTLAFVLYAVKKRNQPLFINGPVILPAFVSGMMWGVAQIGWFLANDNLGFIVAFPFVNCMPGLIGIFWGVLLFGEIKGQKNFILTAVASVLMGVGGLCVALSSK